MTIACAAPSIAQERFDSPEAAAQAVIEAAEHQDSARLSAIFGSRATGILTSGSSKQDRAEQAEFARLARAKHRLEISPVNPNRAILAIGEEDWPFRSPFSASTAGGASTPLRPRSRCARGRSAPTSSTPSRVCHGYVEAQLKYASEDRDKDGLLKHAPRLMSTPGRHDGLCWEGASDPLVPEGLARAAWDGGRKGRARPYHGYYFQVLEGQGSHASGGAHNYFIKDQLIGGFGLVAWPAAYGVTGIHTFIVNQEGVVHQKDVAPVPVKPSLPMKRYDPDHSWEPVE